MENRNKEKDVMEYVMQLARMARRHPGKHEGHDHPPRGIMRVLHVLGEGGTVRPGDIAEVLDIRAGSLTETLAKMEPLGLIKREKNAEDSRIVDISLTKKGAEVLETGSRLVAEQRARENAVLTGEERAQFAAICEKLIAFFAAETADYEAREGGSGHHRKGHGKGSGYGGGSRRHKENHHGGKPGGHH